MTEHWIRLRGGWEMVDLDGPSAGARRLALPAAWGAEAPRRLLLRRRFGRPPLDAPGRSVWLRLAKVPGLLWIRLNGSEQSAEPSDSGLIEILLDRLLPRNELDLRVDRREIPGGGWGEVALVIRGPAGPDCNPWPEPADSLG